MTHINSTTGKKYEFTAIPNKFMDLAKYLIMSCNFKKGITIFDGEFLGLLDEEYQMRIFGDFNHKGYIFSITKNNGSAFVSMHYTNADSLHFFRPNRNWICNHLGINSDISIYPMENGIIDAASKDFLTNESDLEIVALLSEALAYRLTNKDDLLSYDKLSTYVV